MKISKETNQIFESGIKKAQKEVLLMEQSISRQLGFTYEEIVEALAEEGINSSLLPRHQQTRRVIHEEKTLLSEKQQLLKH